MRLTPDRLAALSVTLAPLVYFHAAVRGLIYLSPEDGMTFNVPLRVAAAAMMREGFPPLWNPHIFSGMPLHASAQAGVLFPLNWFYLFFAPHTATNLMVIGGYAVAALGAYLYARRAGSSVTGAVVTSLVWQWSGFLVGQLSHVNIVQTAAMLPWLLWAIDGYGAGGKRKYGLAVALFVCLQAFTGHQQTLAYSLLLAGAYAVCMARASKVRDARARYLSSLLLIAAGVALAAVQILPTLELLRNSVRSEASYDFFSSYSLPPRLLSTFVAPYVYGGGDKRLFLATYVGPPFYGELIGYVGAVTLSLVALALILKRDTRTKFWAIAALVCLALALGRHWPFHLYALVYHVPILNLFRVPARHMMEVDFALAFLAGRGVTAVMSGAHERARLVRWSLVLGGAVFLLACLAVTVGRPAELKLGRTAPVSVMRAPELFLPVVIAALSAWALYLFARARGRGASTLLLLAVLALDLCLWGQSSGWRTNSPPRANELWNVPEPVKYLRAVKQDEPYRILTYTQPFDPRAPYRKPTPEEETEFFLSLQPDTYMPHRLHNAAGYDGFGLARYSRLADDMKVWGDLVTPQRSIHGQGREFDLLNVRYLIAKRPLRSAMTSTPTDASSSSTPSPSSSSADPSTSSTAAPSSTTDADAANVTPAAERVGGELFAAEDLGTPYLERGARLFFNVPRAEADRFVLLTNLSWSVGITDGTPVGKVRLRTADNRTFDFDLRAGEHTSEWAYDRADIRAQIKHRRAPLGTSYPVADAQQGNYEGHTYVAAFALPTRAVVTSGEIAVATRPEAPNLSLKVMRASFVDTQSDRALALRNDWLTEDAPPPVAAATPAAKAQTASEQKRKAQQTLTRERDADRQTTAKEQSPAKAETGTGARWRSVAQFERLGVYENTRRLPRAWLTHGAAVLPEQAALDTIRTGKLPGGVAWEPRRTVLLEAPSNELRADGAGEGRAEVTRYEPNRVDVKTASAAPSVLVLGDNYYPGWRARLDGREVALLRVNYNLRGVALPPGEHEVSFVYRPTSLLVGLVVSLVAAALLALWTFLKDRGRRPEAGGQKSEEA